MIFEEGQKKQQSGGQDKALTSLRTIILTIKYNILMRNGITSKKSPLICISSLKPSPKIFLPSQRFLKHKSPSKGNDLTNSISCTIDQIYKKIGEIQSSLQKGIEGVSLSSKKFLSVQIEMQMQNNKEHSTFKELNQRQDAKRRVLASRLKRLDNHYHQKGGGNGNGKENKERDKGIKFKKLGTKQALTQQDQNVSQIYLASQFENSTFWSMQTGENISCASNSTAHTSITNSILKYDHYSFKPSYENYHLFKSMETSQIIEQKSIDLKVESDRFQGQSQLAKLLYRLKNQILLDCKLMDMKQIFNWSQDCSKWQKLRSQLIKNGFQFGQLATKSIFLLNKYQQNSYSTAQISHSILVQLVKSYISAENHWKQYIQSQFDISKLQSQNFTVEQLDLTIDGHISIQALVYYVNCQLKTFYRNRDLSLIFKRFKKAKLLTFQHITKILSQNDEF